MSSRGTSGVTKPRYCAQHRHEVPGFEKLGAPIGAIDEWHDWLSFESRNLSRTTKMVGAVVLTAAVVTPAAWAAAPAIGGALGGMTGLSGAAATSHGLAMLGGGSIAAGGFGMAGGTAVVSAVGAGLGGVIGGTATAAYVSSDPSFRLQKLRDGTGTPVLVASGFLTDKDDGWGTWKRLIDDRYPDRPVYRVHWGAKELKVFGTLAATGVGSAAAMSFARTAAGRAARKVAGRASWFGWLLLAKDVAANPWTVAKTRAGMTGAVLADLIARTDEPAFVLVGHSLGARVMATAAQLLGTRVGCAQARGRTPPRRRRRRQGRLAHAQRRSHRFGVELLVEQRLSPQVPLRHGLRGRARGRPGWIRDQVPEDQEPQRHPEGRRALRLLRGHQPGGCQ